MLVPRRFFVFDERLQRLLNDSVLVVELVLSSQVSAALETPRGLSGLLEIMKDIMHLHMLRRGIYEMLVSCEAN